MNEFIAKEIDSLRVYEGDVNPGSVLLVYTFRDELEYVQK